MGAVGFVRMIVVGFLADEFFHEVTFGFAIFALGTHDCSFEAEPEAYGYAVHEGLGKGVFEAVIIKICEKP